MTRSLLKAHSQKLGLCLITLATALACSQGGSSKPGPSKTPAISFNGPFEVASAATEPGGLVTVHFTHPIDSRVAEDSSNFVIEGLPLLGSRRGNDQRTVVLETDHQIPKKYLVTVKSMVNERGAALTGPNQVEVLGQGEPQLEQTNSANSQQLSALQARGWKIFDDPKATTSAPSKWSASSQGIQQKSNIYGGSTSSIPVVERFGSYLIWTGKDIESGWIEATLSNGDDDAMGLILRYQNPQNYLRFEWERQRRRRRLVEVKNGQQTELAFDNVRFQQGQSYRVRFSVWQNRAAVFVDQKLVLGARLSSSVSKGHPGLFCWGSNDLSVKDIVIQEPSQPLQQPKAPFPQRPDAPLSTHGVSSSGLTHNSVLLWNRASEEASVKFQLSTEPRFIMPLELPAVLVTAASDYTVTREVTQLQPETRYYFRALLSDPTDPKRQNSSEIGSFMTFPRPQDSKDLLFAFAADFHGAVPSRFPILDHMVARQPDFMLSLGDFPYTDSSPIATTLEDYRSKHRRIRSYDQIKTMLKEVPMFGVWDDHEVRNNWSGSTSKSRIQAGTKVWKEYFAYRPTQGSGGGIYRKFQVGQSVEIFLLDTRFFRSRNSDSDGPNKTMLGSAQKQWLLSALAASKARYKIIISSVPLRYGTTGSDHWQGYTYERTEIFDFIKAQKISRVLFLSGDQHWSAVHRHPEGPVEVQVGPISVGLRTPPSSRPAAIAFRRAVHSYGLVRVDAAAGLCFIELYDKNDMLIHTEVIP
jgi:hypothetical protein